MIYRIITNAGNDLGLVLGRHTSQMSAWKAQEKDNKSSRYGYNGVQLLDCSDSLEIGECYPNKAEEVLKEQRRHTGTSLMVEVLQAREGEGNIEALSARIAAHGWTVESLEEEFLEALAMAANLLITEQRGEAPDWSALCEWGGMNVGKVAPCWQGRCVVMGRMVKNVNGIKTTAAELCRMLGVTLPLELRELDEQVRAA